MYRNTVINSAIYFIATMVIFQVAIALEIFRPLPFGELVIIFAPMTLIYGSIIFYMNKNMSEFKRLVEDNLHSQVVGEYLSGNLSRRKLKKILKEK